MEKILIISYSFPPDNVPAAQRPYFMAKYLKEKNLLEPIVLTHHSSSSSLGKSNWADISKLNVISTGTEQSKVESVPNQPIAKAKRTSKIRVLLQKLVGEFLIPDKALPWYWKACRKAKEIMDNNPDIKYVYSTSPSQVNHLLGLWIKKRYKVKWIADFRDFYYCFYIENSNFLFRHHIDKRIERAIVDKADKVTFIIDSMINEFGAKYPSAVSKFAVIHNGYDPSEFDLKTFDLPAGKKLTIFYGGSFYKGVRSPKWLLQALEQLVQEKYISPDEIEIKIAGNVPIEIFDAYKNYRIYSSVKLLGLISRKNALEEMLNAHFLWLITGDDKRHNTGFPVKGYEYIGSRRHILAFTQTTSEVAQILEELNCGTILGIHENALESNVEKLKKLIEAYRQGVFSAPIQIDNNRLKKYTRSHQAELLFELIKN